MAAVEAGSGRIDTSTQRRLDEVKRGFTSFQEGDVLFAKITPCMENGKSTVAHSLSSGIGFGSTEFHVLRPLLGINPHLLYYFVAQESFRQAARAHMTGSAGQLRVPTSFIADATYPLAPLAEQHRIVSAIEQQFIRLDTGVAALRKAQVKLKRYRAAVLKAAVEGKLTEAWRAGHPTTEPASILLDCILKERRAKWEADLRAKGKDPAKVKYVEPAKPDIDGLPELPGGWCWATIEAISETLGGYAFKSEEYSADGFQIVKIGNVKMGRLSIVENQSFIKTIDDKIREKYTLKCNDILITLTGTRKNVIMDLWLWSKMKRTYFLISELHGCGSIQH